MHTVLQLLCGECVYRSMESEETPRDGGGGTAAVAAAPAGDTRARVDAAGIPEEQGYAAHREGGEPGFGSPYHGVTDV